MLSDALGGTNGKIAEKTAWDIFLFATFYSFLFLFTIPQKNTNISFPQTVIRRRQKAVKNAQEGVVIRNPAINKCNQSDIFTRWPQTLYILAWQPKQGLW